MATTATTIDTSQVTSTNTSISTADSTPDIDTANLLYQDKFKKTKNYSLVEIFRI